jgi:hypothetical protein
MFESQSTGISEGRLVEELYEGSGFSLTIMAEKDAKMQYPKIWQLLTAYKDSSLEQISGNRLSMQVLVSETYDSQDSGQYFFSAQRFGSSKS